MQLSIVIPAHNEAKRLEVSLPKVAGFARRYQTEIIVVDNGSNDGTGEVAEALLEQLGVSFRVLWEPRRGKGLAVKRGMLEATGKYRLTADADLATPPDDWPNLLAPILADEADIVIGSRHLPKSKVENFPFSRRFMSAVWAALVQQKFPELRGITDTQSGFKAFSEWAARWVFERVTIEGMGFDVQALVIARLAEMRIIEVPVRWRHDGDSRVGFWDPWIMLSELELVRRELGAYPSTSTAS